MLRNITAILGQSLTSARWAIMDTHQRGRGMMRRRAEEEEMEEEEATGAVTAAAAVWERQGQLQQVRL
jgi:hypothetical protein